MYSFSYWLCVSCFSKIFLAVCVCAFICLSLLRISRYNVNSYTMFMRFLIIFSIYRVFSISFAFPKYLFVLDSPLHSFFLIDPFVLPTLRRRRSIATKCQLAGVSVWLFTFIGTHLIHRFMYKYIFMYMHMYIYICHYLPRALTKLWQPYWTTV